MGGTQEIKIAFRITERWRIQNEKFLKPEETREELITKRHLRAL